MSPCYKRATIAFDFTGIPLISSSFADGVFGKLFLELGALDFMRRCSFPGSLLTRLLLNESSRDPASGRIGRPISCLR
jgi:hypothetical protein